MNANELADALQETEPYYSTDYKLFDNAAAMLRQQQAEIEELEKENTDLRYLIATKLEQQDGISLNSMAHPITNTPEPSYEIDPDKLETIEIDLPSPEPVAWMDYLEHSDVYDLNVSGRGIPLYTHPHPDNLGLAESIIKQQQAEIEALNQRIERMIENASHHEGIAHAGGFEQGHEIGRQLGMKQERAMWELAASTQEIEKWSEHQ